MTLEEKESVIETMPLDRLTVDVRDNVAYFCQEKFNQSLENFLSFKNDFKLDNTVYLSQGSLKEK